MSAIPNNILFINGTDLSSHPMEIHSFGALTLTEKWKSLGNIPQITEKNPMCFWKILCSTCKFMSNRYPWRLLPMVNAHGADLSNSPGTKASARVAKDHLLPRLSHPIPEGSGEVCLWWEIFLSAASRGSQDNQGGWRCPHWGKPGQVKSWFLLIHPKEVFFPLFSPSLLSFAFWAEFSMHSLSKDELCLLGGHCNPQSQQFGYCRQGFSHPYFSFTGISQLKP